MFRNLLKFQKSISLSMVFIMLFEIIPSSVFALTGGPSQPEFDSFEPAGASEMVNLFTGDFTYNIPIMDVDGYPLNISYHGGVNMDQEASWVGLGWNLNPGVINRGMRGLPDDFNGNPGENMNMDINIKPQRNWGVSVGGGGEIVGLGGVASLGASLGMGVVYNNYKGLGYEFTLGTSGALQLGAFGVGAGVNAGANLRISNQDGVDFTYADGLGVSAGIEPYGGVGETKGYSTTINSRTGVTFMGPNGSKSFNIGPYESHKGQAINLIPNTAYVPNLQFGTSAFGVAGEIHVGGQIPFCWCNVFGSLSGSYSEQDLQSQNVTLKSYGYLNLENADKYSAIDFNRDKDGVYYLESPKLSSSSLTYDFFNANAQGLSVPFRSYRNDVGTVYDNYVSSQGNDYAGGLEANFGGYFGIGGNYTKSVQSSHSGVWNNVLNTSGVTNFKGINGNDLYEQHCFKSLNELNLPDANFDSNVGQDQLAKFKQIQLASSAALTSNLVDASGAQVSTLNANSFKKQNRVPRTDNISYLTVNEASKVGIDKIIKNYPLNTSLMSNVSVSGNYQNPTIITRDFSGNAKPNHISEITVTKDDGARYVFGIPVYNNLYKEAVFNASQQVNPGSSLALSFTDTYSSSVVYYPGTDNAVGNNQNTGNLRGVNHYYNAKTLPSYASSFLLTELLSSDYVDKYGDGVSDDDYGNYVKFNYSKISGYKWRVPYEQNTAIYSPNLKADPLDDLGSYVYGSKDLWYNNTIVTKNYVAVFYTSNRQDAIGVTDENGGRDMSNTANPVRLEKISLFSKKDFFYNSNTAVPLKTVHFVYDNSLCKGIPNSSVFGAGKLTLTKVYFTYGNSDKSVYNSYQFNYADFDDDGITDAGLNPTYDHALIDRWGTYQSHPSLNLWNGALNGQTNYPYSNTEFPYTIQNKTTADNNAKSWQLSTIITPAGSKIRVQYEADDYAYVQNIPATQMALIAGACNSPNSSSSNFGNSLYNNTAPNLSLLVDISMFNGGVKTPTSSSATTILLNQMLPPDNNLYFNAYVQVSSDPTIKESVPGYVPIDKTHTRIDPNSFNSTTGCWERAIITIQPQDIDDANSSPGDNVNPISKAAWQMTRLMLPRIAYPGSEPQNPPPTGNSFFQALAALAGSLTEVLTFNQKNGRLRTKGYASQFDPRLSFVRLTNPNMVKFGGGHRVKQITIQDGWYNSTSQNLSNNSTENTSIYGQSYDYTMIENGQAISSGVASYEPLLGGDENSNRTLLANYAVKHVLAPNDNHFLENPIGEPFYPAPLVGYRKITVRNISHYSNDQQVYVANQAPSTTHVGKPSGYNTYEFYTAKDFPITNEMTGIDFYNYKPDPSTGIFNNSQENDVWVNQGMLIRLNNMHGKPKSAYTYQEGQSSPISGVKYNYKVSATNPNQLDNNVQVIGSDDQITFAYLGRNIEAIADFREQETSTFANQYMGNVNVSPVPPFEIAIPIPSYFQGSTSDIRSFHSSDLTKIITQQGILTSVETINDYTHTTSQNLLWDKNTGEVIVSQTQNEFNDPVYSFEYPAYWIYKGMGPAFQNQGFVLTGSNINMSTAQITPPTGLSQSIHEGDEVYLILNSSTPGVFYPDKLWISKDLSTGNFYLVDIAGNLITYGYSGTAHHIDLASTYSGITSFTIKVIRSGFRNMQTVPTGQITSLKNFISGTQLDVTQNTSKSIIEAEVTEFSDSRQPYCYSNLNVETCRGGYDYTNFFLNPYANGQLGNWYPRKQYTYLVNRDQQANGADFNIRKDGTFDTFKPFWLYSSNSWLPIYNSTRPDFVPSTPIDKWFISNEVTKVNVNGHIVESRDAINRYASSLDAYNHTLKKAEAVNAKYRQIGYDGFEDYSYNLDGYYNLGGSNNGDPYYKEGGCDLNHFEFYANGIYTTTSEAHTGRYSMQVSPGVSISLTKQFNDTDNCATTFTVPTGGGGGGGVNPPPVNQTGRLYSPSEQCNCIPEFSPISNLTDAQIYVLSFWAKESTYPSLGSYLHAGITISLSNPTPITIVPTTTQKSVIIDGWQKIDYYFSIPSGVAAGSQISFTLNSDATNTIYYDDVRIHPFNATMQTTVYDPVSLRLWATLDDRNYATFYEYDNEGTLVRTKKETEKGIQTIQEKRHSLIKK